MVAAVVDGELTVARQRVARKCQAAAARQDAVLPAGGDGAGDDVERAPILRDAVRGKLDAGIAQRTGAAG